MKKLGGILALSLAAVVACDPTGLPPGDPTGALGFAVRPGATQYPASSGSVSGYEGLMTLVPAGDCVLGFGTRRVGSTGNAPATWAGADGCTRLVLDHTSEGAPEQPPFTLDAPAVVPGPDGSVIGLSQWFYRRDRSGEVVQLFRPEQDRRTTALARAGRNLVGIGIHESSGGSEPVAWVSGDEGRTAREIALPHDAPGNWTLKAIAAEGDQVLVAGSLGTEARMWTSGDAGETWTASEFQGQAHDLRIATALRVGGKWLLGGSSAAGAMVVTGEPGTWQVDDPASLGDGGISGGTVDKAGNPVLIGVRVEQDRTGSSRACSMAWTRDAGGWHRGELGCPRDQVSAAATLQDGRVILASSHDLWIRPDR